MEEYTNEIIGSQVESTRTTKKHIDAAAVEIVDEIIGSQVESTRTIIDELRSIARRKFFAGKTVWFVILMTILAIGFGFLTFKIFGLPMFLNPELDQVTGVATGKMARVNWTYVLSPILGFAFWFYFIYMTDLGIAEVKLTQKERR